MKNKLFRWLSAGSMVGLVLQMILPANFALAQAASIGSLRSWEDVITSSSADLHFSFSSAGYFRFDYGTAPESYTSSSSQVTLTNTSYPYYSIMVSGLTPSTTYYYRLASKTLNGTEWAYTSSSSFTTTAADTSPPNITSISATLINMDSATINFTPSEAGFAKIEYGTSGSFGNSSSEISVTAAGSSTNIWIQGLTAGTTYSYRIIARDNAGNSGPSDTYTFTTLSSLPSAPTGLSTSGSTATTIGIYWTDNSINETEFRIERRLNAGSWLQTGSVGVNVTTYTDPISGAGTYEYRVKACNSAGCSAESNTVSRTMAASAPAAPTNLSASYNSAGTSVNVSWTDNSSDEWGFRVSRREKAAASWFIGVASVFNNSQTSNVVTYNDTYQLVAGTTYEYVVRSYNTYESAESNMATAAPPGAGTTSLTLSGIYASTSTEGAAYVYFTVNKDVYAKIQYGIGGSYDQVTGEIFAPAPNFYLIISGLPANTTYNYRVVGRDATNAANTITSGSYTFTTRSSAGSSGAPTISGVHVMIPGSTTTQLMWTCDQSCYAQVSYGTSANFSGTISSPWTSTLSSSPVVDLAGLTPNTTYYAKVRAKNSSGITSTDITYTFTTTSAGTTTDTTPPVFSGVYTNGIYTSGITTNSVYINFTVNEAGYAYVEYGPDFKFRTIESNVSANVLSTIFLSGLGSGTSYNYRVTARDSANNSATSGTYVFGTMATTTPLTTGTAGIKVIVKDPWGGFVSGAIVNMNNFSIGGSSWASGNTGADGSFTATNLAASSFNIGVSSPSTRTDLGYISSYPVTLVSGTTITQEVTLPRSTTGTATTTPPSTGTAGIRVIVKDTAGGFVSGSNVSISNASTGGSSWASGYTGADGSYTFTNLAAGSYNLGVSAPSNRTDLGYVTSYPASLTSGTTATIDITLPRSTTGTPTATSTPPTTGTAGIRITVKDTAGGLVSGANISISNAQTGGSSWASGYTGADGAYTASNLAAGSFNIGVSAPSSRTDLGYVSSYPVTLVSGATVSADITLPRSTTTPTPTNDTTAPVISGVHIMDNNSYRTQVMWGTDDSSYGQVEYGETTAYGKSTSWSATYSYSPTIDITGLSVGKLYHYRVRAKNQAGLETTSGDYTFTAGSSTTPTPTIFTVEPARSYPQSGASEVPLSNLKIHIEFSKSVDPNTVSGADLFFGFLGSTDGTSLSGSLDVFSNGFNFIPSQPLKSNTSYNFIVRSTIWAQTGEQLAGDYSISFTTAKEGTVAGQGTIKGTVKDGSGQPVSGAYVSLRAGGAYATYTSSYYGGGSSSGFGYNQTTQTTTYGEYTFTNLAPGTYTLEAYPPSGGGGFSRPDPQSVTIAANETVIRDFAFGSSSRFIKGTVKFSDGSPVTDAEVSAYRREGSGWTSTPTGSAGEYSLAVGSGSWMVSIRPRYAPVPYATAYPSGSNFYSPPPAPPAPSWVYTNPPVEVYVDTESKVVDFTVPRQSANTSVSGTLERADGEPLSDGVATVRFIGQGGFSVSTAVPAGGRFSTPINPGGYKVYVDLTDSNLSSPDFPPISVSPGEQKDIGVIRLYGASASISGRVTTPDGKGIARVKVGGWKMNSSDNSSASTDEKGEYVLKVSSGEWTVGIMPTPDQPYTTTAPPQVVRVKGGRVSGINFVLAASDGIVNGVVTDESGNILSDFYGFVRVGSKGGSRLPGGAPVERGQFTLRLPAGSYILYMELPPNAGYGWPAPVPITVATGESVKVAMKMAASASSAVIGYLVDQAGNKITNAPFKVFASGEGGGWYSAITDEAIGYYKLKLPAGTWFIGYELAGEENSYERLGGRKKKVRVAAGEIVSLDLEVVRSSGKISGVIRDDDGNGVANVWIAIASSQFGTFSRVSAASWRYLNGVNSDEKGNFTLNVPPGIYYVRAFVPPSMNFINPEEQKVRVAAGAEEAVELVLRARETTITGKTTIAGLPNWAFVWAWSDTGGYTETSADDSGNYKLKVSSGDTWHVAAMAEIKRETFKASEVELVITHPGNYPLSLDLTPLGVKLPEPVTVSAEADQMTVAENSIGSKLVVPANAAGTEGALNVSITPQVLTPSQGADRVIGFGYEMEVRTPTGQEINTFNSELTVSIPYDPLELGRLNLAPTDLTLRFWDDTSSTWQMIENAVVDETNHVVTGSVAHLTRFALVAATDTEPPAAPSQVKAKVAGDGVVITWQKPKDKDLKYVKVYRSAKAGVLGEVVANNLTAATYKDSGMARGTTYYYVVRAVDAAGNESVNTAAVKAAVSGKGTLGKKIAKGITAAKQKQTIKGTITDINLAASTVEIKNKAGKKVIVSFSPTLQVDKDGKKVSASTLKVGNTITAEAAKDGTALTLLSAKAGAVKVKIKGKVKGAATVGGRGKVTVKVNDVQGQVQGASIKRGQDAQAVIQGGYLLSNGRVVPVEHLLSQGNVIVEGVLEDGGVTVTRITTAK